MTDDGLQGSDNVFEGDVPGWIPAVLRPVAGDLTINEVHAIELGLLGLFTGPALRLGFVTEVAFFTAVFVGLAFGFRRIRPESVPRFEGDGLLRAVLTVVSEISGNVAARTVGREPWYFLTVYVLLSVASWTLYPLLA